MVSRVPLWKHPKISSILSNYLAAIREYLRQHWILSLAQLAIVAWIAYWWKHLPAPGFAIGALAFVAAILSIRIDAGVWERAIWILLIGAFLTLEFRTIHEDARVQADRRSQENQKFQDIANGLKQAMQQNQEQFTATMNGIQESIKNVTGGDSYCFLDVFYPNDPGRYWTVFHKGNYALYEVEARVVDVNKFKKLLVGNQKANIGIATTGSNSIIKINDLSPLQAHAGLGPVSLDASGQQKFDIYFMARNGFWTELLRLQNQKGKWYEAKRVIRIESGKPKVVFEEVDKGYHNVDWTE